MSQRANFQQLYIWLLIALSLPVKLVAAQHMVWEMDYVPVIMQGQRFFTDGIFPVHGSLSSVAAYNMPFLVWLQMPAMLLTRDPFQVMLITQLVFNVLTTWVLYRCGKTMFSMRVGLIAAALFTFSEISISGSYTAWAQFLLPGFLIMVFYCLWQWTTQKKGVYLLAAGGLATAAVMTHFAAIMLLPAMLLFAVLTGARWQWRWLVAGVILCGLLLMPYLIFEIERDFLDIKSFLQRQTLVAPEIMAQYENIKPGADFEPAANISELLPDTASVESVEAPAQPASDRTTRILQFIQSVPGFYLQVLRQPFAFPATTLPEALQFLRSAINVFFTLLVYGCLAGICPKVIQKIRQPGMLRAGRLRLFLCETVTGRLLLIFMFMLTVITGYIITRATPVEQPTYYFGLFTLLFLVVAVSLDVLVRQFIPEKQQVIVLLVPVLIFAGLNSTGRILRVTTHDKTEYSLFNAWLYRSVEAATDWIASDWQRSEKPTISYDILPEMRHQWWILPWNTVDNVYRMGSAYDALLRINHNLENANQAADGLAENADYIIVYEPGLERYNSDDFERHQFGAIYVLEPRA